MVMNVTGLILNLLFGGSVPNNKHHKHHKHTNKSSGNILYQVWSTYFIEKATHTFLLVTSIRSYHPQSHPVAKEHHRHHRHQLNFPCLCKHPVDFLSL
jgi:hypothetical protein